MRIKEWPRAERPREKLIARGAAALSDAELLAICLRSAPPGITALDLARELLAACGGLRGLLDAKRADFCARRGLGPARYAELKACQELGRRYLESTLERGDALSCPAATRRYLTASLRAHPREVFACLFLDNRHRVLAFEELFLGTINGASVHPREVVRRVLEHNAAAIIVAHNHPSGVAEPSTADHAITRRLKEAMGLVDVRLLDHVVVGDGEVVSFAERGWL